MSLALFDLDDFEEAATIAGFQMQSLHDGTWTPMETGVAPKVWEPRRTAEEAVHKCLEWTGMLCIPSMRVVDLADGAVVWQDTSEFHPEVERIVPGWAARIYDQVRSETKARAAAEAEASGPVVTIHCFWGSCKHTVKDTDPERGSRTMQAHYDADHGADLTKLGYPPEGRKR